MACERDRAGHIDVAAFVDPCERVGGGGGDIQRDQVAISGERVGDFVLVELIVACDELGRGAVDFDPGTERSDVRCLRIGCAVHQHHRPEQRVWCRCVRLAPAARRIGSRRRVQFHNPVVAVPVRVYLGVGPFGFREVPAEESVLAGVRDDAVLMQHRGHGIALDPHVTGVRAAQAAYRA